MSQTNVTNRTGSTVRNDADISPPVNVIEDATGITLYADLPGVSKDKLSIQVEADTLSIEGELALAVPAGMQAIHSEINLPRFRRVFTLSKELDAEQVNAEFKQGVLKLYIPKAAQAQSKKINVNVH